MNNTALQPIHPELGALALQLGGPPLLDLIVPGQPRGKGRPRASAAGGHVRMYTDKLTASWERDAAQRAALEWRRRPQIPVTRSTTVVVDCVLARPQRLQRSGEERQPCSTKPDIDNVLKIALDALVEACVLEDDRGVTMAIVGKAYAAIGETEHTRIRLWCA